MYDQQKWSINGTTQWVTCRGQNEKNPVLLWLDDGFDRILGHKRIFYNRPLYAHFTVVNWHQRGFGKSFYAVHNWQAVSLWDYVDDIISISRQLSQKSAPPKIFLLAQGWNTILALLAVHKQPDLFYAYIGVSQRVPGFNHAISVYDNLSQKSKQVGDFNLKRRLKKLGPPPYDVNHADRYRLLFHLAHQSASPERHVLPLEKIKFLLQEKYSACDLVNSWRGVRRAFHYLYPQLVNFDLQIPKIDVPVYLLFGRKDNFINPYVAEDFFDTLDAPKKTFFWFEKSGGAPAYEEPSRFNRILIERIKRESFKHDPF